MNIQDSSDCVVTENLRKLLKLLNIDLADVDNWHNVYSDHIHDQTLMQHAHSQMMRSNWNGCNVLCTFVLDVVWEQLNTGHWSNVDIGWRHLYSFYSAVKAIAQFAIEIEAQNCESSEKTNPGMGGGGDCEEVGEVSIASINPVETDAKDDPLFDVACFLPYPEESRAYFEKCHSHLPHFYDERETDDDDEEGGSRREVKKMCQKDCLYTCDYGLLMGAPIRNDLLTRLVQGIENYFSSPIVDDIQSTEQGRPPRLSGPQIHGSRLIARASSPSLQSFRDSFLSTQTPLVMYSILQHWPALGLGDASRKWTLSYIKRVAGRRLVPIEIGSKYTNEDWSQKLMTLSEFIDKFIISRDHVVIGYLAQHELFQQIIELSGDFTVPDYCSLTSDDSNEQSDGEVSINAWFGPADTISPLHTDPKHNILTQVFGKKYIRIYHSKYTCSMYPYEGKYLDNTSQVDCEKPDLDLFPKFGEITDYSETILQAGEALYIPPGHWHYIRSLTTSFSISFWWK